MLQLIYNNNKDEIQVGMDEAGRGCLFGPVVTAAVIWNHEINNDKELENIRDSKKLSKSKRRFLKEYIENNAFAYCITFTHNNQIDNSNILKATMNGMHECLDNLTESICINRIIVDGNFFQKYKNIDHNCIISGDDQYVSIAAASILAKTYHDEWIKDICMNDDTLQPRYHLEENMGYGTKAHIEGIKTYGITKYHRSTFCKNFLN